MDMNDFFLSLSVLGFFGGKPKAITFEVLAIKCKKKDAVAQVDREKLKAILQLKLSSTRIY